MIFQINFVQLISYLRGLVKKMNVACCFHFQMLYKLQNLLYKMQNAAAYYIAPQYSMKLSYAISPFGVLQSCPEIIEHSKTE